MLYNLKNGKSVLIREVEKTDAENFINLMKTVDSESKFLGREPFEFDTTLEEECKFLENIIRDETKTTLVAICDEKVVGQISVSLVRNRLRFKHRAEMAIMIMKDYTSIGIGGKLMTEMINWCKSKEPKVEQIELEVVANNEKAISLYKSFGFEKYGVIPNALKYQDGTYADEYFMLKKL